VQVGSTFSVPTLTNAGVPQGAVTTPLLFNLYISDQPSSPHTLVGDFSDDKAILASSPDSHLASSYGQNHLDLLQAWYKEWGVKMNKPNRSTVFLLFDREYVGSFSSITNPFLLPNAYAISESTLTMGS
jgi:hypothetical protein